MSKGYPEPADTPAGSQNNLERGDFPEPGQQTSGGGAHRPRSEPTPSKAAAGRNVTASKGTLGGGRGAKNEYSGIIGGGDTTKCKGVMGY